MTDKESCLPLPNFVQGFQFKEMDETFTKKENGYVLARALELSSLLNFLLENGWLKEKNLKGPVLDIGTGNGVGLLTLRQFTLGYLLGVDRLNHSQDYGYSGSSAISTQEVVGASVAGFRQNNILDFLKSWPLESASLITAFYATPHRWEPQWWENKVIPEIGNVLIPGGQFLFTSDEYDIPTPNWGKETVTLKGEEGENSLTLVLPVPRWIQNRFGPTIENAKITDLLETEFFDTHGTRIGLIRDRHVRLFTK